MRRLHRRSGRPRAMLHGPSCSPRPPVPPSPHPLAPPSPHHPIPPHHPLSPPGGQPDLRFALVARAGSTGANIGALHRAPWYPAAICRQLGRQMRRSPGLEGRWTHRKGQEASQSGLAPGRGCAVSRFVTVCDPRSLDDGRWPFARPPIQPAPPIARPT